MPLFEMTAEGLHPLPSTSFGAEGIRERNDLQRVLRDRIDAIAPGAIVIDEEFKNWDDSSRRIDLLCLDSDGTLVIVELKRSEDGGFMDLQSIRYAAMVSSMTFDQAVSAHADYLARRGSEASAIDALASHLDDGAREVFGRDVRIVLVSANFSKELTTSVIWLNERGLDIRCVRIRPHRLDDRHIFDIQQIIPLPEAADYQIRIREKLQQERIVREQSKDYSRYDLATQDSEYSNLSKRMAAFHAFKAICRAGHPPEGIAQVLGYGTMFVSAPGDLNGAELRQRLSDTGHSQDKINRYFMDDEDLIKFAGNTYSITKMWQGDIAASVEKVLQTFPTEGIRCSRVSNGGSETVLLGNDS